MSAPVPPHCCRIALTPALRSLVETALALRTTNNRRLADALVCSEETVKSGFRRLSCQLNTHSRSETLLLLLLCGAIPLPTPRSSGEPTSIG